MLTKSRKRRSLLESSLGETGKDSNVNQVDVDFDRYVHEHDLQFENDLRHICWRSRISKDLTMKILQNHRAKQERKSKIRHASESTVNSDENIVNGLAQIILIEEEDSDEKAESCDSHDDTVSIESQQPRDREWSQKMAMIAGNKSGDRGQGIKDWALDDAGSTVLPTVPSAPPTAEKEALALMQQRHARQMDAVLMKMLDMLHEEFRDARDRRGSERHVREQVLRDLRQEEARFHTRQAERVEEEKRIRNEILRSEKDRREEVKRTREQARKEAEAEFARLRERQHEEEMIRAEALKAAEESILQRKERDGALRMEIARAAEEEVARHRQEGTRREAERRAEEARIKADALRAAEEQLMAKRKAEEQRKAEYAKIREEIRQETFEAQKVAEAKRAVYEHKISQEAAEEALAGTAKTNTVGHRFEDS